MQTIEHVASLRAQLWDAGYRPIAVLNGDHSDPKIAGKAPIGRDWGKRARQNPPEAVTMPPVGHALNTGILCDGLRAIDIDIDDPEIASRCRGLVVGRFGEAPIRMRRNSSRCLILYRAASGEPPKLVLSGEFGKIEVLGKGQQFVAFGTHPSGAELEWFPDGPGQESIANIPAISEDELAAFLADAAPIIGASVIPRINGHDHTAGEPQADPLRVAAALHSISNDGPPDWDGWNRIGMAIWRATGGSTAGWESFNAWSARNASYDPAETRERWDHYFTSPPDQIGAGTLFHLARESARQAEPEPELQPASVEEPKKDDATVFAFELFRDVAIAEDANDFVEGLLISSSMVVIYGESNSGKTFFATDLGLHIACGWEWNGRAVDRGAVIYLALEGAHGIRNRIAAFRAEHGLESHDIPFAVIPIAMNLLDPTADTSKLIRTIEHVAKQLDMPVRLTIADTLSRAMAGGNENAPDDMGALVTNGTRIQQTTKSAMAWVHHSGKDQAKGARGHSLLRAATDTEIEITAEGPQRMARITKQRDLECVGEHAFTLKLVDLGKNHRKKAITSCVVEYQDASTIQHSGASSRRLTGHPKRALEILVNLCAETGQTGHSGVPSRVPSVPADWWRERFYDRAMPGQTNDTKKHAFGRASGALINGHLVGMASNRVWIVQMHETSRAEGTGNTENDT